VTLEGALRAVQAALEAGDAVAAAEAMRGALAALEDAQARGERPSAALAEVFAACQPLVVELQRSLEQQQRELGDGSRASRAYRPSEP
jgi:hypothetical protein